VKRLLKFAALFGATPVMKFIATIERSGDERIPCFDVDAWWWGMVLH